MTNTLETQLKTFLHDYKKRVFEIEHDAGRIDARRDAVNRFVKEVLDEKSHFHFHSKIDKQHAEMLDLIYDFCHEALLPPVVKRLAERVAVLEERQQAFIEMVKQALGGYAAESNGR
jgi:hypothetical protein